MAPWSAETVVAVEVHDGNDWLDITRYVLRRGGPVGIGLGKQSTLAGVSTVDDGRMSMVLNNGIVDPDYPAVTDTFTRSVTDGWGTSDSGHVWTISGGAAADYDVTGTAGTHTLPTTATAHRSTAGSIRDVDITFAFATDTLSATAGMSAAAILRAHDASNNYLARLTVETDQTVTAALVKVLGGTTTVLASATVAGLTHAVGTYLSVRAVLVGGRMRMRAWATASTEPATWHVQAVDSDLPAAGDVGIRTIRNGGNTSGTTIFSIDNFSAVDALAAAGRFTSGYINGPFYPWWREAIRVRARETVGSKTFDLATMSLEVPDVTEVLEGVDNLVAVSAVDRLARLGVARPFISVLGEHIIYTAGNLLQAYYPLGDNDTLFRSSGPVAREALIPRVLINTDVDTGLTGALALDTASGNVVSGDDLPVLRLETPVVNDIVGLRAQRNWLQEVQWSTPLIQDDGELVTLVVWVSLDDAHDFFMYPAILATTAGVITLLIDRDNSTIPVWQATVAGDLNGTITGPVVAHQKPTLLGLQFGFNPDVFRLWVDDNEFTNTFTGSDPASTSYDVPSFGSGLNGLVGHFQVYRGAYTHEQFLAQLEVGRKGHERQKTGDRIRMVCNYAGIPDGDLDLDPGVAYLQAAQLAGRTPRTVLDRIVETEQGRLFVAGDGRITFHDRRRTYNI